jgi:hypothetical protein
MKYIKTFEDSDYLIGYYVIMRNKFENIKINYTDFENHIGQIVKTLKDKENDIVSVQFDNDLNGALKYHDNQWWFYENDILYKSKNKEELEIILQSKKYNL